MRISNCLLLNINNSKNKTQIIINNSSYNNKRFKLKIEFFFTKVFEKYYYWLILLNLLNLLKLNSFLFNVYYVNY